MLLTALTVAEKQKWLKFWTGDESWMMWVNQRTESWVTIDEELPQRMPQTITATKSMPMVFFNPKEFSIVNLLPLDISVTAVYFVSSVILPLATRHAQQLGISAVTSCICISTIPSAALFGMSKNQWPAIGASVLPTPDFTRLGHGRPLSVWPVKATTLREDLGQ
jgi:hypothetical protein